MPDPKIRIERVKVRDVQNLAIRPHLAIHPEDVVPVTSKRAIAYACNPVADNEDIGMLLAKLGDRCIGYLGIMPGLLKADGAVHKVHWFSSWYIVPEHRASGAGAMLMMQALALKVDLLVTGTSREADEIFRALQFKEIGPLSYGELYMDALDPIGFPLFILAKIAERKGRSSRAFHTLSNLGKRILNPILKRIVYGAIRLRAGSPEFVTETIDRFDEDCAMPAAGGPAFYRSPEIVNWMLANPWITENVDEATRGYVFADYRSLFRYHSVRIRDAESNTVFGQVVMSISEKDGKTILKVLDYTCPGQEGPERVAMVALRYAAQYAADRVVVPSDIRDVLRRLVLLRPFLRTKQRAYFCKPRRKDSALTPHLDNIELQFTDGDCAFT